METGDRVFEQFIRDYLRLAPAQLAFARRVLLGIRRGALPENLARQAAH